MAKLTEFENPLTGKKGSIFDIGGIWNMILGVIVVLFAVSMGQNLARGVSSKIPALDTQPEALFKSPVVVTSTTQKGVI